MSESEKVAESECRKIFEERFGNKSGKLKMAWLNWDDFKEHGTFYDYSLACFEAGRKDWQGNDW